LPRRRQASFSPVVRASKESLTYKDAGVDTVAGNDLVDRIKKMAPGIGGFSGLFPFGKSNLSIMTVFYG